MTSARDLIGDAHRSLGLVASGNVLPEAVYQDNLRTLNMMIESWNTQRLSVYATETEVFTWPAMTLTQSIGPTGDFVTTRPIQIDESTYFIGPNNLSYSLTFVNQDQYNGIALKTVTSTYPNVIWVNNSFPDMELTVYPKPTSALEWHIVSVKQLAQPATLATEIALPPGYLRAFRYNLACELAPEFNMEPPMQIVRIAVSSKRNLRRINNPDDLMAMPYPLVQRVSRFNIYTGSLG